MKKNHQTTTEKLALNTQTLRKMSSSLTEEQLEAVIGGRDAKSVISRSNTQC